MRIVVVLLGLCSLARADVAEAIREPLRQFAAMEDREGIPALKAVLAAHPRSAFPGALNARDLTTLYWLLERNPDAAPVAYELVRRAFPNTPRALARNVGRDLDRVLARKGDEKALAARYGAALLPELVARLNGRSVDREAFVRIAAAIGRPAIAPLLRALAGPPGPADAAAAALLSMMPLVADLPRATRLMMQATLVASLTDRDTEKQPAHFRRVWDGFPQDLRQDGPPAGLFAAAAQAYYEQAFDPSAEGTQDTLWYWRNGGLVDVTPGEHVRHLALAAHSAENALRLDAGDEEAGAVLLGALADRWMVEHIVGAARGAPRAATERALRAVRAPIHRLAERFPDAMQSKPDSELAAFLLRESTEMAWFGPNQWTLSVIGPGLGSHKALTRTAAAVALAQLAERTRPQRLALDDGALATIERGLQHWSDPDARDNAVLLLLSARRTPEVDRRLASTFASAEYATDDELRARIAEVLKMAPLDPENRRWIEEHLAQTGRWRDVEVREKALLLALGAVRTLEQDKALAHHLARESMGGPGDGPGDQARTPRKRPKPTPRRIRVFYGTDRAEFSPGVRWYVYRFRAAAIAVLAILCLPFAARWLLHPRIVRRGRIVKWTGWCIALFLVAQATYTGLRTHKRIARVGHEYGGERGLFFDDETYCHFGWCDVGIPESHVAGELERPAPFAGDLWEDPDKHILMLKIEPLARTGFLDELEATVDRTAALHGQRRAFVFVHGFNVTFEDAALRTAQIAHDLRFSGAPIFFSWPSQGGLFQYTMDESSVAWATRHLKLFLKDVRTRLPEATIHLVAHSMGNRAMTEALRRLADEFDRGALRGFQQLVLAAPDIDAATFRNDIVPELRGVAERITLYASSKDRALRASHAIHGYPRAGDTDGPPLVVEGVDTIDCSALESDLIGHSYYGSAGRVLADMIRLLVSGEPPLERGLRGPPGGPYAIPGDEPD